jgi:predicted RNA-binding protein
MDFEVNMCLSTIYVRWGEENQEVMRDVARMEAEGEGYTVIDLFGAKTFVQGQIASIDFVERHRVVLRKNGNAKQ